jgi:UDP-N-acetylmuramoylalanine--D-glutamate ligase
MAMSRFVPTQRPISSRSRIPLFFAQAEVGHAGNLAMREAEARNHRLVLGLGQSGQSVARFLQSRGEQLRLTDTRKVLDDLPAIQAAFPQASITLGENLPELWEDVRQLVVSPGVSVQHPWVQCAMARGIEVIGDIELFARYVDAPVYAITGSNGKSTVTSLLGAVLQQTHGGVYVGGNLGTPALDLLLQSERAGHDAQGYVLELSSFQLETTFSLAPRIAIWLNLSADHLDRYTGLEDYAQAKARILHAAEDVVVNAEDAWVRYQVARHPRSQPQRRHWFRLAPPRDASEFGLQMGEQGMSLRHAGEDLIAVGDLPLMGLHNAANVLAVWAATRAAGLADVHLLTTLKQFQALPHRGECVREWRGVRWLNDSKATNVGAAIAALQGTAAALPSANKVILIAGGQGKGQDFLPLRMAVRNRLRAAVLIGEDAGALDRALRPVATVVHALDLKAAVSSAEAIAQPGDVVLLSPACASLDQFRNYEDRGAQFTAAVEALS